MSTSKTAEIESRLDSLCPPGVHSAVSESAHNISPFNAAEAAQCADFSNSRRIEFLTSRQCARTALKEQGYSLAELTIDSMGVPQWPKGFTGSITHSRGLCGAVAAKTDASLCLGLDFERTGRLSSSAAKRVIHPLEASFAADYEQGAILLFSLKEAFYKAQFPVWAARANFQDLALSINFEAGEAALAYLDASLGRLGKDAPARFNFSFSLTSETVISLCHVPLNS